MEEIKTDLESDLAAGSDGPVAEENVATNEESAQQERIRLLTEDNLKTKEQLLRLAAEFDNYRKRNEREIGTIIQNANADLIYSLLPVVDDLERILQADQPAIESETLRDAVRLVYKNFFKILHDAGLVAMRALDQPFDPEKHDALLHLPVPDKEPNQVVEEHKKGYEFHDRVLRHAQVIVSK